jgi:predicted CoA-binding protein
MDEERKEKILRSYVCAPSTVAMVGASPKKDRPVFTVMKYCLMHGFRIFPVNPQYAGHEILGCFCYAGIRQVPVVPDIVALFLSPKTHAPVREAMSAIESSGRPVVWMQPGAEDDESERLFLDAGFEVVRDDCIMRAHMRACGGGRKE